MTAAVDVLIPVYNGEKTVEAAVLSIQRQTFRDLAIVLIDDGSTDSTPERLANIASRDPRISLLRQENGGIVDALNAGWRTCSAPLIARHDADDIATPDRIEKQVSVLRAAPSVVALSGAFRHIDEGGAVIGDVVQLPPPDTADPTWIPAREPYLLHPLLMLRRSALDSIGGYRHVFHAEDADLYWRLQEIGQLRNIPDVLGLYRISGTSVSSKSIVNGRVQALSSQMAAISACRRRAGKLDIDFRRTDLQRYECAATLDQMIRIAREALEEGESRHLAVATANKLLSLSTYRPYRLESSDCSFICEAYRYLPANTPSVNRREIVTRLCGAATQLLLAGQVRNALTLCPPPLYAAMVARAAARAVLPASTWRDLRRLRSAPKTPLQ